MPLESHVLQRHHLGRHRSEAPCYAVWRSAGVSVGAGLSVGASWREREREREREGGC